MNINKYTSCLSYISSPSMNTNSKQKERINKKMPFCFYFLSLTPVSLNLQLHMWWYLNTTVRHLIISCIYTRWVGSACHIILVKHPYSYHAYILKHLSFLKIFSCLSVFKLNPQERSYELYRFTSLIILNPTSLQLFSGYAVKVSVFGFW